MKAVLALFALVIAVLIGVGVFQQNARKSGSGSGSGGHAGVFDTRPFEEAKSAASSDGKVFLVKFTATWCGPCHWMDQNTFADASVEGWLEKNAVIVSVDVDQQKDIAGKFRIEAMPTIVAMRGDKEIARTVGAMPANQFLGWVKGLPN